MNDLTYFVSSIFREQTIENSQEKNELTISEYIQRIQNKAKRNYDIIVPEFIIYFLKKLEEKLKEEPYKNKPTPSLKYGINGSVDLSWRKIDLSVYIYSNGKIYIKPKNFHDSTVFWENSKEDDIINIILKLVQCYVK